MSNKTTVRILNLHGGGIRGYMSATVLARFCTEAGINPNKLYEAFDIISGTSIGGIQALGYANGTSPSEFKTLIENNATTIFNYGTFVPWVISRSTYALAVLMGLTGYPYTYMGQTIYSMYESGGLQTVLTSVLGANTLLSNIPGKVIIPSWDVDESKSVFFSNITGHSPLLIGDTKNAVSVGLCTSAAPTYFQIQTLDGHSYSDGGVFQNNPVGTVLSVARRIYPNATRFCILSIGTGVSNAPLIFDESGNVPYNIQLLNYLSNNAFIPGPQQAAQELLSFDAINPYEEIFTYQFQYTFLPGQDSSMDNPDSSNLIALASYANAQYDADTVEIANFIEHFNMG
jgi:patatin-like phospholipase/acyl hydrolase